MDGIDLQGVQQGLETVAGPFQVWVLPALLGLGLASATGLRTFLPLLMLALAVKFRLFGIELNDQMSWLADWPSIAALGVAAVVEFAGDKIPVVDHGLNVMGAFTRPVAGAIAAGSVFAGLDPTTAAVAGIIVGAPAAFAFNAAQGGARLTSTATTGGVGNPILSFIEDVLSVFTVILALLAPILVPVVLIVLAVLLFRLANRLRAKLYARNGLTADATRSP
ncbi:DUF4126 domain-containing protein [Brevundimonas sp. NIBR11]|uniref:DUF4126 domain-containing protein n=1 Tax=Brevundimonas sp. NIBR11 TaxID=3015999 RepID=UPI0022F048B2|nr:DUF4126 domain-containing protein [Brevundimonas sp. NIBR11]WGM32091.1 hypothetical protein KKHFBJBL_02342 [Brevundimonas sp. NIBR11]